MYYLLQANAEAPEDLLHVAALLHGDDTQVILLIHPDQERLVVVVPGGIQRTHMFSQLTVKTKCLQASILKLQSWYFKSVEMFYKDLP